MCSLNLLSASYGKISTLAHTVYDPPEQAKAPPLLITHGMLGSRQNWNSIAKATARSTNRKVYETSK